MRSLIAASACLLALALAACGSSGGGAGEAAEPPYRDPGLYAG
jgi:hypothetical protein